MKSNRFIKRLDWYIIKKFLGTYVFAIALIISIAVVFDFNEKMDKLMEHEAPWDKIIFEYYMNFIPYFSNLFSPLFVFIAVIFFTSKLAENSEIIAMFSTGMSFKRMMRPYMISAARTYAFIKRRGYVIPEDVRAVAHDVLRHRIGLTYEAEANNMTSDEIISKILNKVEVP